MTDYKIAQRYGAQTRKRMPRSDRHALLMKDDQGNLEVTICNSRDATEALREVVEEHRETYGIMRVIGRVEALTGRP